MKYYLAYGSNLNKDQMAHRCPTAVPVGKAIIPDYKLVFRRGVLTIEPCKGNRVPVGVWTITAADEKALDRYEGYPNFYYKEQMTVMTSDGQSITGMVYIMTDGNPVKRAGREYLMTVAYGYRHFGFDMGILMDADLEAYEEGRP